MAQVPVNCYGTELGQVELIQFLNLTPEQYEQIEVATSINQSQIEQAQQILQQAIEEFQLLVEGVATTDLIRAKYWHIQQLQQQDLSKQFETMLAIREILNQSQRRKLAELMKEQNFMPVSLYNC
ncbi:MAG: hypothetical protein HC815_16720 [Richelia sp. RM1_1_1]|nr:hypothetical protein [Richelia sp. SM1_7_0]NJN09533.1 hypothetical protein [Richelia sp. RM1_1_1]